MSILSRYLSNLVRRRDKSNCYALLLVGLLKNFGDIPANKKVDKKIICGIRKTGYKSSFPEYSMSFCIISLYFDRYHI